MFQRILNIKTSCRNAFLLVSVYALHLVFLQVLMTETPINKTDNSFRPLFTHTTKSPINSPKHHPAVSYYTQLIKQGFSSGKQQLLAPTIVSQFAPFLIPAFSSNTVEPANTPAVHFQLAEDIYKRYCLFQVFLI